MSIGVVTLTTMAGASCNAQERPAASWLIRTWRLVVSGYRQCICLPFSAPSRRVHVYASHFRATGAVETSFLESWRPLKTKRKTSRAWTRMIRTPFCTYPARVRSQPAWGKRSGLVKIVVREVLAFPRANSGRSALRNLVPNLLPRHLEKKKKEITAALSAAGKSAPLASRDKWRVCVRL